ncbi:hypothetical protein [Geochorda subterranea]|uniref:Uncharacterized protein n=1 Tax=Geochorda subterranea TaxID=3109564 RepID=A0ABZ1BMN0_9FIRM|nr:hypothetical protein [Limnochorda sp. LNt]WRP13954.1 hypothetical protein VLY81_11035 [Limnochorda sp. LNt]
MRVVVASPAFAAIAEYLPRFLPGAEVLFAGAADLPQVPGGEGRPGAEPRRICPRGGEEYGIHFRKC